MSSPLRRALAAGTLALATAAATLTLVPTAAQAVVLPNNFKSVGYMPSWAGNINTIQYNKLTHINYAFVLPNSNGSLQGVDGGRLSSLVSQAHANNVKVSIAVGGWNDGNDSAFEALAGQLRQPDRPSSTTWSTSSTSTTSTASTWTGNTPTRAPRPTTTRRS